MAEQRVYLRFGSVDKIIADPNTGRQEIDLTDALAITFTGEADALGPRLFINGYSVTNGGHFPLRYGNGFMRMNQKIDVQQSQRVHFCIEALKP